MHHAEVVAAIVDGSYRKWNLDQLNQGISAVSKDMQHWNAAQFNAYIQILQTEIDSRKLESERQHLSEESNLQRQALMASVEQGRAIATRLDGHHGTHRSILKWSRIGGWAAMIAATTGILVVVFEAINLANEESDRAAKRVQSTTPMPPQSRPASATSAQTITTNSTHLPTQPPTNTLPTNSPPRPPVANP
jgi:hypothetical protein